MRNRALLLLVLATMTARPAYTAEQYIEDVLNERIPVCKYVRLAVERHLNDLERVGNDPDFPYYFDPHQAQRAIDFKQQLRHTQGEFANPRLHDTHLLLEPWQQFKDWVLFGWRNLDGTRRFTKAYIEVARKNGKTTDAAATANYCFFADRPREMGPEVYCVGPKKDQGKISWEEAKRQIEKHPVLKKRSKVYKQNSVIISHTDSAAKMTVWVRSGSYSWAIVSRSMRAPGS